MSIVFDWERSLRAAPSYIQYPSVAASKKNAPHNCRRTRNLFEAVRNIPAREISRAVNQLR
ncbi:hypothetical protein [Bradyrhizobium sp. CCBAU 11386]|uniref:hypothetical protein n=1 Tax=Bradyrhizobium sp. CCBAU 11386 TaxID=1630837 RepID=UPI002302D1C6|nr:hypothetical protein [Bradyrhizobium sp. CCBAU 11386]